MSTRPELPVAAATAPRRLAVVDSLSRPEALSYDAAHDEYFVSNVNGTPGVKDGNGFISRIGSDGKMDSLHFIQGSRNGVVLNGPMGSRIRPQPADTVKGTPLAPDLTDSQWIWGDGSLASITKTIREGVPAPKQHTGVMPPMGGAQLTPAQLAAVGGYIYSLSHSAGG